MYPSQRLRQLYPNNITHKRSKRALDLALYTLLDRLRDRGALIEAGVHLHTLQDLVLEANCGETFAHTGSR